MRLWTISPEYLDVKGLVALWREGLLAQKVLEGKTKGYRNHPQLFRFKESSSPMKAIGQYLFEIYREACKKGYKFNEEKIKVKSVKKVRIKVNKGQIKYEWNFLKEKIKKRNKKKYTEIVNIIEPNLNSIFLEREGGIEKWERIIK
jgi:hypothetical protein